MGISHIGASLTPSGDCSVRRVKTRVVGHVSYTGAAMATLVAVMFLYIPATACSASLRVKLGVNLDGHTRAV